LPSRTPKSNLRSRSLEERRSHGVHLTNGEIADRLYLSPRTVASHLYRSYPKLGIAGRHQLRDLVDQAGADPGP
jgi:DNA-binding CsgD family transcriptional regulator